MKIEPKHISSVQFPHLNAVQQKNPQAVKQSDAAEKDDRHQVKARAALSNEEKRFFEKLFPNAIAEIRSYQVYQHNGLKSTPELGKLIDLKG
jgi:hypothetical protein